MGAASYRKFKNSKKMSERQAEDDKECGYSRSICKSDISSGDFMTLNMFVSLSTKAATWLAVGQWCEVSH